MSHRPATATAEVRFQLALGTSGALAALSLGALVNLALSPSWGSLIMALLHLISLALVGGSLPTLRVGRVVAGEALLLGGTMAAIMLIGAAGANLEQSAAFTFVVPVAMAALLLPPRRLVALTAGCALLATVLLICRSLGVQPLVRLNAVPLVVSGMAAASLWLVMLCLITAQRQERSARQAATALAQELVTLRSRYEHQERELQALHEAYQLLLRAQVEVQSAPDSASLPTLSSPRARRWRPALPAIAYRWLDAAPRPALSSRRQRWLNGARRLGRQLTQGWPTQLALEPITVIQREQR